VQLDKLIARIRNKEESAYIQIIEKYSRLMWKIAWEVLGDAADAADVEDCISEVFYKLWKSSDLLDPEKGNIKNYLAKMTRNTAIDFLRKQSREKLAALDEAALEDEHSDDVIALIIRNEEKEALQRIIEAMNAIDKELITRRFFDYQKPAQISTEMQIPIREVTNRLYRIKISIREQLLYE
jgi:RNA polymerase sigma-70 factor (ECF subfamily)